jgi:hypothetical protein
VERHARRRTIAGAVFAGLLAAITGAAVLTTTPALASTVPTATVVGPNSPFDSTQVKTTIANCPAGQRVLGGGVRVNAGDGHIVVTRQEPVHAGDTNQDSFVVEASEDGIGTTNSWALQAYAVCTPTVNGIQIVSAIGPTDSSGFLGVVVRCPANKFLLGAGGRVLDGQGHVSLVTQTMGSATFPNGVNAGGFEEFGSEGPDGRIVGFKGNWSVIAFAVCAPENLTTDIEVVRTPSVFDQTSPKILLATCPTGKRVTGSTSWADVTNVVNSANIDTNRLRVQLIASKHEPLFPGNWGAFAEAICWA